MENEVCAVANYATVCLDYVSSITVSLARSGKLAHREADADCRILHTTSEAALLLQAKYYEALEADFAARASTDLQFFAEFRLAAWASSSAFLSGAACGVARGEPRVNTGLTGPSHLRGQV